MPKGVITNPTGKGGFPKGQSGNPSGRAKQQGDGYESILERTRQSLAEDPTGTEVQRDASGRFPKGVSGNPGGRAKDSAKVAEAARAWTLEAIATLADSMLNGQTEQARNQAAVALLNRGWGQPTQAVEQNINDNRQTPEELKPDMSSFRGLRERAIAEVARAQMAGSGAGLESAGEQALIGRH